MATLAFLQNIGLPELIVIMVIALLIFGHKLPQVARSLGSSVNEFKKGVKEGEEESKQQAAQQSATPPAAPAEKK
jgi:sec-independent protein translocase protein TatA